LAVTTSDEDGFREIQLNGKQLVFLFMAVTVVLVVTFLTGVLVGRGVRAERAEAAQADALTETPPSAAAAPAVRADATGEDPTKAAPPAEIEESTQPPVAVTRNPDPEPKSTPDAKSTRKDEAPRAEPAPVQTTKAEPRTPSPAPAAAATATAAKSPAAAPAAPAATNTPTAVPSSPPSGPKNGYAVQVAAVNARGEADTIVRRLSAKGYSAYVEVPKNTASVFRVRVGTFRTRREAQTMADRLKKEEKFKPWVTR
jgi:cell division septation protein DedD